MKNIVNISAYKFVSLPLETLAVLQASLKSQAIADNIKGTILLGTEGINLILAGTRNNIDNYQTFLASHSEFCDLHYKESPSLDIPFSRMLVRIKKEIVSMGCTTVVPEKSTAPYLEAEELKQWYDEQRDFIILDTRNDYEVALGSFDHAIDLNLESFREFPDAVALLGDELKEKPVVTFCTGGIRCEKAAALMQEKGFKNVYQLKDGILNYFEKTGGAHYHGECFVFDKRLTVNRELEETNSHHCYQHRNEEVSNCPYCQHIQNSRKEEAV